MEKICITIEYKNRLERITVDYKEDMDISSIREKPIPEWFEPGKGRDGWEGLVPELQYMVNDNKIEWVFDFKGDDEHRELFKKCMKEYDPVFPWSADGMPNEEAAARNLELAHIAELKGNNDSAQKYYFNAIYEIKKMYEQEIENGKKEIQNLIEEKRIVFESLNKLKDEITVLNKEISQIKSEIGKGNLQKSAVTATNTQSPSSIKNVEKKVTPSEKKVTPSPSGIKNVEKKILSSTSSPEDFEINGKVLIRYKGSAANVTIPNGIKVIKNWAFSNCRKVVSVTIPDSVTSIGGSAFYNCTNLESVTIPKSVKSIGRHAFHGCLCLESVTIPKSCTIDDVDSHTSVSRIY